MFFPLHPPAFGQLAFQVSKTGSRYMPALPSDRLSDDATGVLSLVPNSLLQFRTLSLPEGRQVRARFFEEELPPLPQAPAQAQAQAQTTDAAPEPGPDSQPPEPAQRRVALRRVETDPATETQYWLKDGVKQPLPPGEEGYLLRGEDVLEIFGDEWIPLPFFARLGSSGQGAFLPGPTNWARVRLRTQRPDEAGGVQPGSQQASAQKDSDQNRGKTALAADLAFDTTLEESAHFTALQPQMRERELALVSDIDALGAFLSEDWVNGWLKEIFEERRPRRLMAMIREEAENNGRPPLLIYQAAYLTLLDMLARSGKMPTVRLTDEHDGAPVQVDLVLDLGNFRSCGILIEELPGMRQREADSFALQLRDLSQVDRGYDRPFSSRIEFARASFGRENYSRRSGRAHAFAWPSPVRTGPQAERLMAERSGNEGNTGLSTPKRYLWDTRPAAQGWVYNNGDDARPDAPELPVNGPFRAQLYKILSQGRFQASREDRQAAAQLGPCFLSRSELSILMLEELLLQAVRYINAPEFRHTRPDSNRRRQLRSVMITMPPGMPLAVQRIFRRRAEAALELASAMAGITPPRLNLTLDEATATQLVWLHNEIKYRLGGEVEALYRLYGSWPAGETKTSASDPEAKERAPSLRIASLDIGGGTTDLMIARYALDGSNALVPHQEFRESFDVAGDDLLRAVIARVIVPPLQQALEKAGVPDAHAFLKTLLDADRGNQTVQERYQRLLLTSTLLEPAALHALGLYERIDPYTQGVLGTFPLSESARDTLKKNGEKSGALERCKSFFSQQLSRHLAAHQHPPVTFDILQTPVTVESQPIEEAINTTLRGPLTNLCEAVRAWGCDVLLLSGRPSKLRCVRDLVASTAAVAPHHMFPLHDYAIGPHYPFRNVSTGKIEDPKTTVVVGAAICAQAERGALPNFALRTGSFGMKSTARYLGRMAEDGQIRAEDVVAELPEAMAPDGPGQPASEPLTFTLKGVNGATMLGYRQLPAESWGATPLYQLEFTKPAPQLALPLTVTLIRNPLREVEDEEERGDYSAQEDFRIDDVTDATGAPATAPLALRLQTTLNPAGYWRDSGYIKLD
ncbi:hypothetical protein E3E11_04985 [Oecophyllibacter saccharovorans]|nr:hypothetical protein E3E11_04985 [Oecophyllibacter saccharovorans]